MIERRKDKRYQLANRCILNHGNIVGTILDICQGGLSCMCLDSSQCEGVEPEKVDVFCKKENLIARGLHVRKLDTEIIPGKYVKEIKVRKCRIQFDHLIDAQIAQLKNIILAHAA